ncbi:tetratricopeptide repeat protein [Caballeronia sp. LjRoot31]|uniref:tetratricopeptide repeat protein n=1 Tax=Caballeronia sp. LjRoot31 TaxID=3342324 RepID=UPI003ECF1C6A
MHQHIANAAENEFAPNNGSSLSAWERVMREAVRTSPAAPGNVALKAYQQALELAGRLIGEPPPGRADDCVAALVVSYHNLADLHAELGDLDSAAAHLCHAHEILIHLFLDGSQDASLQQAALRHSRETHFALLNHIRAHGPHPLVTRALGAGCLALSAAHPIPH